MKKIFVSPVSKKIKSITVQGDKSISHRAVIIGSLARGNTVINGFLEAEDTVNTIKIFKQLGVNVQKIKGSYVVKGRGMNGFRRPQKELYVGNSGTGIRLALGVLAAQRFDSVITGDASITKRPMRRVIVPLTEMGAKFESNKGFAPITVHGTNLSGINYAAPVASAQVKSAIMLAALHASGISRISEPFKSRDHTERMLLHFGADVKIAANKIKIKPGRELKGGKIFVPGDISSAAYFIAAGLLCGQSRITVKNTGINPTRTGVIDVLRNMGAKITMKNKKIRNNEPVADIVSSTSKLKGVIIKGRIIPRLIDEIPVIAVAAAFAKGRTVIKDAKELRVKETDRISTIVANLRRIGVKCEEKPDGMVIYGNAGTPFKYADIDSFSDHRIAMAFSVAGLVSDNGMLIKDIECVKTSFPEFFNEIKKLGA
ncbi:MAG TPA: 3-phosphoshikimate 1-carboxyvinyltransferase [Firmicutes bacterium]|nr:3-phosphoshikimate 1-carboxyvinyltransferase [Bacillota bacterium]